MIFKIIKKIRSSGPFSPNLPDYENKRASFSWNDENKLLDGLPDNQGLNIAYEAVDRHANSQRRDHIAIRYLDSSAKQQDFSYARLQQLTNRFANVLGNLGVKKMTGFLYSLHTFPKRLLLLWEP